MKKLIYVLAILLFWSPFACSDDDNISVTNPPNPTSDDLTADQIAILCMGDSRIEGARPEYESYRYEFWKLMKSGGYNFNLIGPLEDNASYPTFMDTAFDNDHAGIGGIDTSGVLEELNDFLTSANRGPDVVLLGIGGNDVADNIRPVTEVISNIGLIIDGIQANNPNATIVVEIIAGAFGNSQEVTNLNNQLTTFETQVIQLATDKTTSTSQVVTVDMNTGFTNNSLYYADPVHYNEAGAVEIAKRYYDVLVPLLNQQ
ncbi:GDSL-type esterase/lipase family protein [Aquimarina sp. MMG016]|uniref:SGNH/GDSL hydrolase family protein n=1 Tax=Aquimarina sp. MMG016 TaxID=2822690 RepID=UPI001B39E91A|nr:GDSL-type esterase/lipase family protein [Aquimarina sp. MMG016]MBQ4822145.1 hypothetical protein [Aquimarina sp. MMG016]